MMFFANLGKRLGAERSEDGIQLERIGKLWWATKSGTGLVMIFEHVLMARYSINMS